MNSQEMITVDSLVKRVALVYFIEGIILGGLIMALIWWLS